MKKIALLLIISVMVVFVIGLIIEKTVLSRKAVAPIVGMDNVQKYSYTKAFCNSNKECMDFTVTCDENGTAKIESVSKVVKVESLKDYGNLSQTILCNK